MTKKSNHLIRLATLLSAKYASVDAASIKETVRADLQTAIGNAAGGRAKLGIMPFLAMLKSDQAGLSINITRNGDTITVSPPSLNKPELNAKYAPLSDQIKSYLEQNIEVFPTKMNDQNVEYHNLTCTLTYADTSGQPVANL